MGRGDMRRHSHSTECPPTSRKGKQRGTPRGILRQSPGYTNIRAVSSLHLGWANPVRLLLNPWPAPKEGLLHCALGPHRATTEPRAEARRRAPDPAATEERRHHAGPAGAAARDGLGREHLAPLRPTPVIHGARRGRRLEFAP